MRFLVALLLVVGCQHQDVAEKSAEITSKAAPAPTIAPAPAVAPTPAVAQLTGAPAPSCGCGGGGTCGDPSGGPSASCGCGAGCMAGGESPQWAALPANAAWTPLHVTGMHCGGCARRIERALKDVKGVLAVKVDLATAKVEVATVSGTDARSLAKPTIDGLGYRVE